MSSSRCLSKTNAGRKQSKTTGFSPDKSTKGSPSPNPSPSLNPKTPSSTKTKSFSENVVGRKLRVFSPLHKTWYEGHVKSYDKRTGMHLIQYEGAEEEEEEFLDLEKEKLEWIEEEAPGKRRGLKRLSSSQEPKMEVEKGSREFDSAEEKEEEELVARRSRNGRSGKRKKVDAKKLGCSKEIRVDGDSDQPKGCPSVTPMSKSRRLTSQRGQQINNFCSNLTGDVAERFAQRDAEKFIFLGEGRRDAQGRRPGDVDYDPRTLFLPCDFLKSLSGGQKQWWEFKSKHMDKVLFFKVGKFYELFEMDAHVGVKELDLQYMKGDQPHCGFPEKNFSMNIEKLARKGYRVLVVEQTETPKQLELRRKEMGSKDKVVKREIHAMVSKGTLTDGESLWTNSDPLYLMSITEKRNALENANKKGIVIGICVVDVSTSKFMLGQLEDDSERHCLCSILSELRPVEIIKPSKFLSLETEMVLKYHTRDPLINNLIPSLEFWDAEKTINEIKNIPWTSTSSALSDYVNGDNPDNSDTLEKCSGILPDVLSELVTAGQDECCTLSALGGCLFYLRQAFLGETLLKCAKFERLQCSCFFDAAQKAYMILDAAALENLEILENNRNGGPSGTLFAQLNHCVTSTGKRLLKSWLARPLYDKSLILERQDAIAEFKGSGLAYALEFRKELLRLPDVERLLARLFASCDNNGNYAKRVALYEDAAKKLLQEFIYVLRSCEVMIQACSSLNSILTCTESGKGLPDVSSVLNHFKEAFDWTEAERSGRIIPHQGVDIEYDTACIRLKKIELRLKKYLTKQRRILGDSSINYVTVGKDSYLLEVPESVSSHVSLEYELRSSKKGFFRYWTPKIKKYLSKLAQAEADRESKFRSILQRLLGQFSEHHSKWRRLAYVIAELDVLISLSTLSEYFEGPTCRPVIKELCHSTGSSACMSATSLGHPVLRSDALGGKGSFVCNDVHIGGSGHGSFILLTGPNMGGKSTLLRQVCLAVILAQLGADVPAESFELTPVDRIFVRMGARDHIMAGQSTFLTELSETASMLTSATQNSLVALDELGRGTSTSDGLAIAGSVLNYLVHRIHCRGLFSTHYHRLAVEYQNDTKVSLFHMACQVEKGTGGIEEVSFLYRLTPGSCPKSYGINVARLAGIPSSVLETAIAKSTEFEINYGKHKVVPQIEVQGLIKDEEIAVLKDILDALKALSQAWQLFTELQQRAQLILGK
ncbi:DNA mismatch repair protein MSH6-like isoform X2 [Asparagus officinalis]|uniref:DNA mismatch repair protein MSH6-like isoform X2 n=1 Tax=Asparagus officinalis TaxID=4686 RepID=UPI00098DF186|nr:DNA mismatch repair protein MSH6-like isoform X2 [Asparagus officinalis]